MSIFWAQTVKINFVRILMWCESRRNLHDHYSNTKLLNSLLLTQGLPGNLTNERPAVLYQMIIMFTYRKCSLDVASMQHPKSTWNNDLSIVALLMTHSKKPLALVQVFLWELRLVKPPQKQAKQKKHASLMLPLSTQDRLAKQLIYLKNSLPG